MPIANSTPDLQTSVVTAIVATFGVCIVLSPFIIRLVSSLVTAEFDEDDR